MTGPTIRSKKCKLPPASRRGAPTWCCRAGLVAVRRRAAVALTAAAVCFTAAAAVLACPSSGAFAAAAADNRLPVIQQVGVIPVQWDGPTAGYTAVQESLTALFPKTVRAARRFRVLSDELVSGLWQEENGRAELRDQFELHSYVSLTVAPRGDVVTLTTRLLDSHLRSELAESDTLARHSLLAADDKALSNHLEQLVFRLFNRLPVDVSVTSVQGSYITLSGGTEQGIANGDKVDILRAAVKTLHPANGTWLSFSRQPLGTAQVIEAKNYTSVAKISALTYDDAVQVGDGAKVPAIASRLKFVRADSTPDFDDSGEQPAIILPPLYPDGKKRTPAPAAPVAAAAPPATAAAPAEHEPDPAPTAVAAAEPAAPPEPQPVPPPAAAPEPESSRPNLWDEVSSDATSHKIIDRVDFEIGASWWSVKGPTNSSGRFPAWLVNTIGGGVSRTMLYKIKTAFGGSFLFGQTPHGGYLGYDGYARLYWEDQLPIDGMYWRAGGAASLSGLSVPKGPFGGGDWARFGGFGHLGGRLFVPALGERYTWFIEGMLLPMNIGRLGYDGSQKTVESTSGQRFELGAFREDKGQTVQWGGAVEYGDERMTLDNGRRPHLQNYSLKILGKYAL